LSLSLPRLKDMAQIRYLFSTIGVGMLLALLTGTLENAAVLAFSFDTRITTIGIASAITSGSALVVIVFGMVFDRERLASNQLCGIAIFMVGLVLLAV